MKKVTAKERVDLLQPRSSVIGLSISPKANREPPPKNRMKNPAASITQLRLSRGKVVSLIRG